MLNSMLWIGVFLLAIVMAWTFHKRKGKGDSTIKFSNFEKELKKINSGEEVNLMEKYKANKKKIKGFTLIELIAVIVIVAILGALALPRFIDLSKDARIASITTMKGAIETEVNMVYAKCSVTPACINNGGNVFLWMDGIHYWLNWGFPSAGDMLGNGQIDTILTYDTSTISVKELNYYTTEFYIPDAPIPDKCSVTYRDASNTATPTTKIVLTTSGC